MENEIWRPVVGFEGLYMVSNFGRVMTLGNGKTHKERKILTLCKDGSGYLMAHLHKNGKSSSPKVHRLVAEAFIPNPHNLPCINHMDEDKTNNCVWNLEWCTSKYNSNYGTAKQRWAQKNTNNSSRSIPIIQYTIEGIYVDNYPSAAEAQRQSLERYKKLFHRGNLAKCARGEIPTAYGYVWKYDA